MKNPNVHFHIDTLVLHGFYPGDRKRLGEAVRLELTRLLVEQGVPRPLTRDGERGSLNGSVFEVTSGSKTEVIGARVAQKVYEGLEK